MRMIFTIRMNFIASYYFKEKCRIKINTFSEFRFHLFIAMYNVYGTLRYIIYMHACDTYTCTSKINNFILKQQVGIINKSASICAKSLLFYLTKAHIDKSTDY